MSSDPVLEALKARLAHAPGLKRALLFGSRARGDFRPRSDYDLALEFVADAPEHEKVRLLLDLQEPDFTLLKLDCIVLNELTDDTFRRRIEAEGTQIFP